METITPEKQTLLSRFVTVAGVEYHVKLTRREGESYAWLNVDRQPDAGGTIWPVVFSGSAHDYEDGDVLNNLRAALRDPRRRMRQCLENWRSFRAFACAEPAGNVKGSKRGYYTRLANDCLKSALKYAPHWRLAKQLWKEITRL